MLEAAVKAAGDMRILAVTVLTSLDDSDLAQIGAMSPIADLVKKRAQLAVARGLSRHRRIAARGRDPARGRARRFLGRHAGRATGRLAGRRSEARDDATAGEGGGCRPRRDRPPAARLAESRRDGARDRRRARVSGFKDRMRGAKRGPGMPARASDQRVRKEDVGATDRPPAPARPDRSPPRPRPARPTRTGASRRLRAINAARRRSHAAMIADAPATPRPTSAWPSRDAYQRDRDDAGSRRTAEPRITGPGERIVYGAGPVREIVARNPKSMRAIWVDPRRADKSAGDPVAQIVTKARLEGILVEDRDRAAASIARPKAARHQGVVAWFGAFDVRDDRELVDRRRARDAGRARRRRRSAQPRRDPALGLPARRAAA